VIVVEHDMEFVRSNWRAPVDRFLHRGSCSGEAPIGIKFKQPKDVI